MAPRKPKTTEKKAVKSTTKSKDAPEAAKPELKVVAATAIPEAVGGGFKLKDLLEIVATATGGKKPEVKKTVEATLAAMGEALTSGKALTVPPLGKLRVVKTKGPALTLKLRVSEGAKAAGLALADDGEDG